MSRLQYCFLEIGMKETTRRKMCTASLVLSVSMLFAGAGEGAERSRFPGAKSSFHSYDRYDFTRDGRACIVVTPKNAAKGSPWIWRARFFGHEPQTDLALLERGFHVAYVDVAGLFGGPEAVTIWDHFYEYLTQEHGFAKRTVLEGMSRGGLIVYNWAAKNPEKVCCIYADAPVCDIRSWPGGKGAGTGHAPSWTECLEAYDLTESQALTAACNPIDQLEALARVRVPLLHVVGDADEVVPVAENTAVLEQRYRALGGFIEVVHKEGVGHHPHSLKDPAPIVEFICSHVLRQPSASSVAGVAEPVRERIEWCDIWITNANTDDLPRVFLIGDSITRGYFGGVEQALEGKANCARLTTSRCICDPVFFEELLLVLRQYRFRVIHFNNGLHGMGYTDAQYRRAFARLMEALRKHRRGARLIWATSTPVRDRADLAVLSQNTETVRRRNRIAMEFLTGTDVQVNDLFALAIDHPEYHSSDGVHFSAKGKAAQIEQVSQHLLKHFPDN